MSDEDVIALHDDRVLVVHSPCMCLDTYCCIHNPSDHPLRHRPLMWRDDLRLMERKCVHGVGHPDPDDLAHWDRTHGHAHPDLVKARRVHGCDGCCDEGESKA